MIAELGPLTQKLDMQRMPAHLAIITDGNGRWARARGQDRLIGHANGYRAVRKIIRACSDLGVKVLSFYTFSTENWRRPREEVEGLMRLIEQAAREELPVMHRSGVRILVSGRRSELPLSLQEALARAEELTAQNKTITLHLAINYGGRAELVDAVVELAKRAQQGELNPEAITEEGIRACLYQPDLPDPDLVIRTAGEERTSNFLLWQSAYSELYFYPNPWPDFDVPDLVDAIAEYQRRIRKYGGLAE